jgi:hypothetical protein
MVKLVLDWSTLSLGGLDLSPGRGGTGSEVVEELDFLGLDLKLGEEKNKLLLSLNR